MDEVTKQWNLCGRQVDCTYREKAVPDGKVRITGSWCCGRYENLKIRSTVKKETDVEQYLKRQIEKQLMAYLREEQAGEASEAPGRSPTLMELYRQKYRQYFNEHDWLPSTRDYRLRLLCRNLEEKGARQITEEDIARRMEALAEQPQKVRPHKKSRQAERMKALWILLCRFLEFLVEEGDLRCSPIPERTLKKLDIAKEQLQPTARELYNRRFGKQTLTRQECARLLERVEQSENPLALACALMLLQGMRDGEACGLNFDCLKTTENGLPFIQVECQDEKDKAKKAKRSVTDWLKSKNSYPALHPDGRAPDPPAAGVDSTPSPRTDRRTAGGAAAALGGNTEGAVQSCAGRAPGRHQGCGQDGTGDAGSVYGGGRRKNSGQRGGHRPGGRGRILRRKSHRLRTAPYLLHGPEHRHRPD